MLWAYYDGTERARAVLRHTPALEPRFFKNILSIDVSKAPPADAAYKMTYGFNTGLQAQAGGASALPCGTTGLYLDDGGVTAIDAGSNWDYIVASKQVAFSENLPNPPQLAKDTAIALHALLDMMPWLVCCPAGFP